MCPGQCSAVWHPPGTRPFVALDIPPSLDLRVHSACLAQGVECPANPCMPVQDKMKQLRGKFAVNHPQHNKKEAPSHTKHSKHRAGVC